MLKTTKWGLITHFFFGLRQVNFFDYEKHGCFMTFTGVFDKHRIEAEIEDFLFRRGYELVDLRIEPNYSRPHLDLFIDKIGGVTLKDLSELNRRIQVFLEAGDFFPDRFELTVSSPGLDRVVKKEEDFRRFAGRRVTLSFQNSSEKGSKRSEALLVGFEDGVVIVETNNKTVERIPMSDLKSVRLVPDIDFKIDAKSE
jgi:ribosome maturation factor RimP